MVFLDRKGLVTEYRHWRGNMDADYIYTSGAAGERFFAALRDEGKLLASRCSGCGKTYLPPRLFCETCMTEIKEWVAAPTEGTLEAFTVLRVGIDGTPLETPEVRGIARFKGITGGLVHRVLVEPEKVKAGMKVRVSVLPRSKRTGTVLDIEGFEAGR